MQQVSYGPLIMSIMLIVSCYTGFFNVRRGWQSLNTGPRFYLRLIHRTGWLWIYTSRTTDVRPFKPKKLSVPFLYPGVPAGLRNFKELLIENRFIYAFVTFFCHTYEEMFYKSQCARHLSGKTLKVKRLERMKSKTRKSAGVTYVWGEP